MWIELQKEEKAQILASLSDLEKESLQTASDIMQKVAALFLKEKGDPENVDLFRSIASILSEIKDLNDNEQ